MSKLAQAYAMKKRMKMAKGGIIDEVDEPTTNFGEFMSSHDEYNDTEAPHDVEDQINGDYDNAMSARMAHGGMVDRIMRKRMSQGGMVANDDMPEADFKKADFDDLNLRDDMEFEYDGANSGDELGNKGEDERRSDIVSRIMKSRSKKDRNPNPA